MAPVSATFKTALVLITTFTFLSTIYAQDKITECNDYKHCERQELNNTFINCYGFQSCSNGTIKSLHTDGWIDCTADTSCTYSTITGKGYVYCGGTSSCKDSLSIKGENVNCGGVSSCFHSSHSPYTHTYVLANTNISCSASSSCQNTVIGSNSNAFCNGKKSCHGANIETINDISCGAEQGCAKATIKARNNIQCTSKQSCFSSNITAKTINAQGYQSAAQSRLSASYVNGLGAYSLSKATIDSEEVRDMTVQFFGYYSGLRAEVICHVTSRCNIQCKGNGCKNLKFFCLSGAICNVSPSGCNATDVNKVDGVDCPIWRTSLPSDGSSNYNGTEETETMETDDDLFNIWQHNSPLNSLKEHDLLPIPVSNNNTGDNQGTVCENEKSCMNKYIHTNYTFCYGYESCLGSWISADHVMPSNVLCAGADSCRQAEITGVRSVECNAKWACRDETEISTQTIYGTVKCNGLESCMGVHKQISSIFAECNGESSCLETSIRTWEYTTCDGAKSCYASDIVSDDDAITCSGSHSCSESDLQAMELVCSGNEACTYSNIRADKIMVYGSNGAAHADIYTSNIIGYGYNSLSFSDIDSLDRPVLKLQFLGTGTGYGANIICRSGSDCRLTCKGNACFGTTFLCFAGSTCSVKPDDCQPNDMHEPTSKGIDCPLWKSSLSLKEFVKIRKNVEFIAMENNQNMLAHNYDYGNNHIILLFCFVFVGIICFIGFNCRLQKDNGYEPII